MNALEHRLCRKMGFLPGCIVNVDNPVTHPAGISAALRRGIVLSAVCP